MRSKAHRVAAALSLCAVVSSGCDDLSDPTGETPGPTPSGTVRAGTVGASIVILDAQRLAVASADQDEVTIVDRTTLLPTAHVPVGAEPRTLLLARSGQLLVVTHRGNDLEAIDLGSLQISRTTSLCAGAFGLAESADGSKLIASCESEGTLMSIDPKTFATTVLAKDLSRPRAVVALDDGALVAGFTGGQVTRVAYGGSTLQTSLVPTSAPYRPALASMTANLITSLAVVGSRAWASYELVNHDGDATSEVVAADYGSVTDGNPKINPAVGALELSQGALTFDASVPVLYASYDGGDRSFSAPYALTAIDETHALVTHDSSNDVALLDLSAATPEARVLASYVVGAGPRGIAFDASTHEAFVDDAIDGSISRIVVSPSDSGRRIADQTQVLGLPPAFSQHALSGRRLFHDATNTHVTPAGVIACSTCHPEGGDDGLVWFIHTPNIPLKRRRTPHLGNAHSDTSPFHWDGSFATMEALATSTITDLMAGDALLVDVTSVQAYVDEIVQPPVPPQTDADSVGRGSVLFTSVGCDSCHLGPERTDRMSHAPLSPMSLKDDDVFTTADTPALHGLAIRAPYFHDGRSPTLADLLTRSDAAMHGATSSLRSTDLSDLAAYLRSL